MDSTAPRAMARDSQHESYLSELEEQKLIEGQMQLEREAASRARRVQLRRQRQAKLEAIKGANRRSRAIKIAGFWLVAIIGGGATLIWYTNDVMALISN